MKTEKIPTLQLLYFINSICENYAGIYLLEEISRCINETEHYNFYLQPGSPSIRPEYRTVVAGSSEPILAEKDNIESSFSINHHNEVIKLKEIETNTGHVTKNSEIYEVKAPVKTDFNLKNVKDAELFFKKIRRLKRPVVYHVHNNKMTLLYDHLGQNALRISEVTHNCPIKLTASGVTGILDFLFDQKRKGDLHALEVNKKELEILLADAELTISIGGIIDLLSKPGISDATKAYLESQILYLLNRQRQIQQGLGVREVRRIDINI
jgi:hypothetical protein